MMQGETLVYGLVVRGNAKTDMLDFDRKADLIEAVIDEAERALDTSSARQLEVYEEGKVIAVSIDPSRRPYVFEAEVQVFGKGTFCRCGADDRDVLAAYLEVFLE